MALAAGALSKVSVTQNKAVLSSAAATGGVGAVSYQWYRSTISGFTPGVGNILAGETSLSLTDEGLVPGTQYYYKVVATDSDTPTPATAESAQLSVMTLNPSLSPNSFGLVSFLGMPDQRFNSNTHSMQVDENFAGVLYPGQAVKSVDVAGGVPKVVPCDAKTDECIGFVAFNIKDKQYVAGDRVEVFMEGNCLFLYATEPIARMAQVCLDPTTIGGVSATGHSAKVVGIAYDKASAAGDLIRVMLKTPSFATA